MQCSKGKGLSFRFSRCFADPLGRIIDVITTADARKPQKIGNYDFKNTN